MAYKVIDKLVNIVEQLKIPSGGGGDQIRTKRRVNIGLHQVARSMTPNERKKKRKEKKITACFRNHYCK